MRTVKCPICAEKTGGKYRCRHCGFDLSTDYEQYPTILPVAPGTISTTAKRHAWNLRHTPQMPKPASPQQKVTAANPAVRPAALPALSTTPTTPAPPAPPTTPASSAPGQNVPPPAKGKNHSWIAAVIILAGMMLAFLGLFGPRIVFEFQLQQLKSVMNSGAAPVDITEMSWDSDAFCSHMNELVAFRDLDVYHTGPAWLTGRQVMLDDRDLTVRVGHDGEQYSLRVKASLCGPKTEVYQTAQALTNRNRINVEGILAEEVEDNGVTIYITKITLLE